MSDYLITTGDFQFPLTTEQAAALDLIEIGENRYHLIAGDQSYEVRLLSVALNEKTVSLFIDGVKHLVTIEDENDQLVKRMGLSAVVEEKLTSVKSPMPGLVLDILVQAGDPVEKGDKLLILEAMKMENIIKATGSGTIKSVEVTRGQAVEKNAILLELE